MFNLGFLGASQIAILFLFSFALFGLYIWFLVSLQLAMNSVSFENRKMEGALVWLNLIPLFNLIWSFIFNIAIRDSYKKEFLAKGIDSEVSVFSGILYPILNLTVILVPLILYLPLLSISPFDRDYISYLKFVSIFSLIIYLIGGVGSLIFLIIYWTQVNQLKSILFQNQLSKNNNMNINNSDIVFKNPISTEHSLPKKKITNQSSADKLKKYYEMLNQGLITKGDFDEIKKEILKD